MSSSLKRVRNFSDQEIQNLIRETMLSASGLNENKSIVIEREIFSKEVDPEEAFEALTDKLAKVIDYKREEVENALIATGSSPSVRNLDRLSFNAEVQNKLVEDSEIGEVFRNYMTILVTALYGRSLINDGFFRISSELKDFVQPESKVGSNALQLDMPEIPNNPTTQNVNVEPENILPLEQEKDGTVKKGASNQDWGSILSGSAQVLGSVGGIISLFTGGNTTSPGGSVLDQYSQQDVVIISPEAEAERKRKRNLWIMIGSLVGIALIVVTIVVINKNRKSKEEIESPNAD